MRIALFILGWFACLSSGALAQSGGSSYCNPDYMESLDLRDGQRLVCADIAALDQTLVYNRFGSFNPFGMIFALTRDLDEIGSTRTLDADSWDPECENHTGAESRRPGVRLAAGQVRLRDCKRPRPLVLRANVGDVLLVRVTNLLMKPQPPDFSREMCQRQRESNPPRTADLGRELVRPELSAGTERRRNHGEAVCDDLSNPIGSGSAAADADAPDWPATRLVNLVVEGLELLPIGNAAVDGACLGTRAVRPDETFLCLYRVNQEGTHFLASRAAPAGGEGDGGSIVHGLFGAVMAERPGTRWYRSQVSRAAMDAVWAPKETPRHARTDPLDYEADQGGIPLLNMARVLDGQDQDDFASAPRVEIVHSDLNAIVHCDHSMVSAWGRPWSDDGAAAQDADGAAPNPVQPPLGCAVPTAEALENPGTAAYAPTDEPDLLSFREFTVFFHDELKTFYTRNFQELAQFGQLAGVRDGFAINYGASGMGTMLLANRKGIGPAASCAECLYEEFFLTSWANGDPALLEWYDDDPSNVHHSYLNDPVVFRNFHAGPKETHVFHLHAHQWFSGNDPSRGSYLDSQTVAPAQGFTYNIYHGGRPDGTPGQWGGGGAGNRNRTVGDSIFHCHLYPHFAQGMWALWRVHDVFEDGTRMLPDGAATPGLSTDIRPPGEIDNLRTGSVDPETGAWLGGPDAALGTPIPALVPLPGEPLPPLPSYPPSPEAARPVDEARAQPAGPMRRHALVQAWLQRQAGAGPERLIRAQATVSAEAQPRLADPEPTGFMPGYPFYIAGQAGHRPPQAPHDIAVDRNDEKTLLSGGLGRHVVTRAARKTDIELPPGVVNADTRLWSENDPRKQRELERLRAQIVAKAVAMGDMTASLTDARITTLPLGGTALERSAMAFHHDGAGLTLHDTAGNPLQGTNTGRYATGVAPVPGGGPSPTAPGFQVNGARPAPGAPFADPCGVPAANGTAIKDPFKVDSTEANFVRDPALIGFRRYEGSAVQLDLVVNKAGWHDPQARINVLTARSDDYKTGDGPISPRVSDREEPFFFRALSGECIEFRHTNELPKELELDDFQVRTPTDTIGQHIHLVKFDVTSSDGSGNGWNYEDGTFAPDELMARRCAARAHLEGFGAKDRETLAKWGTQVPSTEDCGRHDIWRLPLSENRALFQTTVQRWFADPITSSYGKVANADMTTDRTMRTVFSHDHFGPSSIQQHGFYTALLIEPAARVRRVGRSSPQEVRVCETSPQKDTSPQDDDKTCTALTPHRTAAQNATEGLVGASKILVMGARNNRLHPDYREFALAVADFALLYDPRDRSGQPNFDRAASAPRGGLAQLACEARHADDPARLASHCGSAMEPVEGYWASPGDNVPPAWIAAGLAGDWPQHRNDFADDLFLPDDAGDLRDHLIDYRRKAAFNSPDTRDLARPVAPPLRPESISVDHHDPYLVNYRMAAIPLRIGTDTSSGTDCALHEMARPGDGGTGDSPIVERLRSGELGRCSFDTQNRDAGLAFASRQPGAGVLDATLDPETPIMEAYQGERLMFRLIQGAQEVQHTFNVAGVPFRRNVDQAFAQGMRPLATTFDPARSECFATLRRTRPAEYEAWLQGRLNPSSAVWWAAFEDAIARCDNLEGMTFAQEVGISEHFEMRGRLRQDVNTGFEAFRPESRSGKDASGRDGPRPGHTDISDYLYNFGTLDSMWNGAWGLVRIYNSEATRAAEHGERDGGVPPEERIGTRLTSIAAALKARGLVPSGQPGRPEASGAISGRTALPTCPAPLPGRTARSSHGVVVALRVSDLPRRTGGTPYGLGQTDPDGLMLALLKPEDLAAGPGDAWGRIDRRAVLDAVGRVYGNQPEPFVMRVNAGDCVILRFVNTLTPDAMAKDRLGDARMPPIVPLNTDPAQAVGEDGDRTPRGRLQSEMTPAAGIRPSALLGLTIGLPGGDQILNLPLGFGLNGQAAPPAADGQAWVSPEFGFYAGRTVVRSDGVRAVETCADPRSNPNQPPRSANLAQAMLNCALNIVGADLDDRLAAALTGVAGVKPSDDWPAMFLQTNRPMQLDPRRLGGERWLLQLVAGSDVAFITTDGKLAADEEADAAPPDHALAAAFCHADQPACVTALDGVAAGLSQDFDVALAVLGEAQMHFIPYAFGPVPVRAMADPVSQVPHGLFGMIDVVPVQWDIAIGTPTRTTWEPHIQPAARAGIANRVADRLNDAAGRTVAQPYPATDGRAQDRAIPPALGFGQHQRYERPSLSPDKDAPEGTVDVREFVLFFQDGLNLHDAKSLIDWTLDGDAIPDRIVPDCLACGDSYDWGEQAVSYRSPGYVPLLRAMDVRVNGRGLERSDDMNAVTFPADFFRVAGAAAQDGRRFPLRLHACHGEQVVVRVIHPGGRARQRAFVMNGLGYDDLFPGFGFPNAALVAPAKSVSAWLTPHELADTAQETSFLWIDGPTTVAGGGTWGLVTLHPAGTTMPTGGKCP